MMHAYIWKQILYSLVLQLATYKFITNKHIVDISYITHCQYYNTESGQTYSRLIIRLIVYIDLELYTDIWQTIKNTTYMHCGCVGGLSNILYFKQYTACIARNIFQNKQMQ